MRRRRIVPAVLDRACEHRRQRVRRQADGSRCQQCEQCGRVLSTLDDDETNPMAPIAQASEVTP
jgi:hypothetical protein